MPKAEGGTPVDPYSDPMSADPGTLYVVATPIGNLEDITLRALRTLREVDLVAAEHVPVARALLRHFKIDTTVVAYHDHGPEAEQILRRMLDGESVALTSDAGTPGMSDPGHALVDATRRAGLRVVPIPGVTASAALWSAAGIAGADFRYYGFLPRKPSAVRSALVELAEQGRPAIVYEAPRRLQATLAAIAQIIPDADLTIGRELTKLHEQIWTGRPEEALNEFIDPRGEFTILLIPPPPDTESWSDAQIAEALSEAAAQGASRSQAARHVSQLSGRLRREIYALWPFPEHARHSQTE